MTKFKIICPECGATLIAGSPEAVLWELCPGCRHHIWETYDLMMAEVVPDANPLNGMGDPLSRAGVRDNN